MSTREEHIAECKRRALVYLDEGDCMNAVTSMLSDISKHPETRGDNPFLTMLGMKAIMSHDEDEARRFIEGFR